MSRRLVVIILAGVVAIAAAAVFMSFRDSGLTVRELPVPRGDGAPGGGGRRANPTVQPARLLVGHDDGVHRVAFSPDGKLLLTASHDGSARLWKVENGEEVRRLVAHEGA